MILCDALDFKTHICDTGLLRLDPLIAPVVPLSLCKTWGLQTFQVPAHVEKFDVKPRRLEAAANFHARHCSEARGFECFAQLKSPGVSCTTLPGTKP